MLHRHFSFALISVFMKAKTEKNINQETRILMNYLVYEFMSFRWLSEKGLPAFSSSHFSFDRHLAVNFSFISRENAFPVPFG